MAFSRGVRCHTHRTSNLFMQHHIFLYFDHVFSHCEYLVLESKGWLSVVVSITQPMCLSLPYQFCSYFDHVFLHCEYPLLESMRWISAVVYVA